jgi:hypothetical protein
VSQVESDEYAVITNTGAAPVNLSGWRLNADDPGQDFYFPNYDLASGHSFRVYTNEIHPESCGFSFGSGKALWANCCTIVRNVGLEDQSHYLCNYLMGIAGNPILRHHT